jgi:hypothetical protein
MVIYVEYHVMHVFFWGIIYQPNKTLFSLTLSLFLMYDKRSPLAINGRITNGNSP